MLRNLHKLHRKLPVPQRFYAQKVAEHRLQSTKKANANAPEESSDEPVQYFGSEAASWSAKKTRSGGADEVLWYQPYVISGSLAIFLLYFCVLREENDIDKKLEGSLYDHVSGLEELQLAVAYKYNKDKGLDTKDLERRMAELGVDVKQLEAERLALQ